MEARAPAFGLLRDKRFLLTLLLCVLIAARFWVGSRYPDLGQKAAMGADVILEDPLGFEAFIVVDPAAPFVERVLYTTLNWIHTNRRGMIFGILLAASLMTLLSLIRRLKFSGLLPNTLLGVVIGTPLGVCVNCAAPIARGLQSAGMRVETTLAAMVSSPTLNVVVLAMLFSLFPLYLALMKVGLTLVFLVLVLPALTCWVFGRDEIDAAKAQQLLPAAGPSIEEEKLLEPTNWGWGAAALWLARQYGSDLWFIVRQTVPLMLLAGFLGALTVTALPWDAIIGMLPKMGRGAGVLAMGLLAVIGLFLPVPMAFDVVVSATFWASGVPEGYVMILLFTLGSFSVYSFFIVWQAISLRVATTVSLALIGLAMVGGTAVYHYRQWQEPREKAAILAAFSESKALPAADPVLPLGKPYESFAADLARARVRWNAMAVDGPAGISVERAAFQPRSAAAATLFERNYGSEYGLVRVDNLSIPYKFTPPFYRDWPVAAGDVHGDGWVDLLFGSDHGLYLYANQNGRDFVLQEIDIPELAQLYIGNATLVDLNNDGWLDIFFSAYRKGNYVIYNDHGRFHRGGFHKLPDTGANLANAVAFGDLDRDGRLEIVLGNWSTGPWTHYPPEESRNAILWNRQGGFEVEMLPDVPGETLSVLISDINLDGHLDLLFGNDFDVPDIFYLGRKGGRAMVTREDGIIPHSTTTTMSIDSADIDNDLKPEIYIGQVTGEAPRQQKRMATMRPEEFCAEYADQAWKTRCERRVSVHGVVRKALRDKDARKCLVITDPRDRGDCVAYTVLQRTLKWEPDPSGCALFPARWEACAHICRYAFKEPSPQSKTVGKQGIPQVLNRNVLLVPGKDGHYLDRAEELGVDLGGWTWNAKFADMDNDEWQDLYIVNGHIASGRRESHIFYHNAGGKGFVDNTKEFGLRSFLATGSYVYADLDNDGDLDMVEVAFDGPVWVNRNSTQANRAIVFELRDAKGNAFGVGSRVVIHYGEGEQRHQMREIKAGGGYLSFDPYVAHFGLGPHSAVARVDIHWSTGESTTLRGEFAAGHRYRVTRRNADAGATN